MANTPAEKFMAGAISASVWNNVAQKNGRDIEYRTVSLQRSYKDRDSNWKSTSSIREDDLPKAILVLSKAYESLSMKKQNNTEIPEEQIM